MPSFDIVSEVDKHELMNAIDQANREVGTRFDFKDSNAKFESQENKIILRAPNEFQIEQMREILENKISKRNIDIKSLDFASLETSLNEARQTVNIKQGISSENAKKMVKLIKNSKLKVQAAIQGEQVRVTGKKKDDLQEVIVMLREEDLDFPLQFTNFRD